MTTLSDNARHLLDTEQIGWLTTVHGDQPQSSPVWFVYADDVLWLRSQPQAGKLRNIADNGRVSFHLDTRPGGNVVTIEATAEQTDEFPAAVREAYGAKYHSAITQELRSDEEAMMAAYSVSVRLTPTRVRGW